MADRDEQGSKNEHFEGSKEDRSAGYREWRRHLGGGTYVLDVDQVEWRKVEVEIQKGYRHTYLLPVATIELTRRDKPPWADDTWPIPTTYLQTILDRFNEEDFQGRHSRYVADRLGVYAYLVVFHDDLTCFWVYNLTLDKGWKEFSLEGYEQWIRNLKSPVERST